MKESKPEEIEKITFDDNEGNEMSFKEGSLYIVKALDHFSRDVDFMEWFKKPQDRFNKVFLTYFGVYLFEDKDYCYFITHFYEEDSENINIESRQFTGILKAEIEKIEETGYKMEKIPDFKFARFEEYWNRKEKKEDEDKPRSEITQID